ncbi:MAG: hypothetical protein HPPSJP_5150 [Candidatus Hepatoplasma scabrum]|nr:MAG: hypothetical protein HPPSJP_5150 [Candidatus Hepatoplasma sp.]
MATKKHVNKNKKRKFHFNQKLIISLIIILIGLYIGMLIIAIFGYNPFTLFTATWEGNFTSLKEFGNFLSVFTWMTFIGLGALVAFRAKIFNIGIFAQMVAGGLFGYLFAALVVWPGRIGVLFSILIPVATGIFIALLIAFLKNRYNINVVVSSIMLNWIVFWIYRYFRNPVNAPYLFNGGTVPMNIDPSNSLRFDWLTSLFPESSINIGIILLVIIVPIIWFLYAKTSFGIKQGIIASSENISLYSGINYKKEIYKAMALSGALSGLAGATFYLGTNQTLPVVGNDLPLEPFNGITIALIGFNSPIGAVFGAIFISLFENAKIYLDVYSDQNIVDFIMGIIVLFISGANYFLIYSPQTKIINWVKRKDEKNFTSSTINSLNADNSRDNFGESEKKKEQEYKIIALEKGKKADTVYKQQYLKMKNSKKHKKHHNNKKGENNE